MASSLKQSSPPPSRHRLVDFAAGILAVGTIALLAGGCGDRKSEGQREASPVPVEVTSVVREDVPVEIRSVGTATPIATVQLKSKVGGEVQKVAFADGAYVKKGQVLFEIDRSRYQALLDRAKANLAIAKAQEKNAEDQLTRYTTLSTKGAASEEQYSQFVSAARQQQAEVKAREAELEEAQLSLDWAVVRSPIDGRAGAALVKAGNIVQAETEVLTIINQLKPIYVSFSIPESDLPDVRRKLNEGAIPVTATDATTGRILQRGQLTFIDNTVDTTSGMVSLKATFANEDESLWPGQFVDVLVELDKQRGALLIPTVAVMESQSGPKVFVVRDGTVSLRDISILGTYEDRTIVESGLEEGEQVVTKGQLRLTDGTKVSVQQTATEPASS